ncbi:MAG TPA: hypothetical protein VF173_37390 [Thermoanaerobaculia bacterium]|nr:hypothetical protein [Thermoanaerobaculia bacterium]
MPTDTLDTLTRIRRIRHEISHEFDNDPRRLVAHYIELQHEDAARTPPAGAQRVSRRAGTKKVGSD